MRTLILGFGNKDRQDDGVAWHIILSLKTSLGLPNPEQIDDGFDSPSDLVFVFQLQLTPEQSEFIAAFDRVCFIDAHTGAVPDEIHWQALIPVFQNSPLTHHLTPESLLSITQTIYNKSPSAVLLSVRGYEFEFSQTMSESTKQLVPRSILLIRQWLSSNQSNQIEEVWQIPMCHPLSLHPRSMKRF